MLFDKDVYGLIVVGRKRAAFGSIKGRQLIIIQEFSSGIPSKHSAGGQSQRRFERIIQEKETKFYRSLITQMNQEFLKIDNLKAVFIGGAGNSKKIFVKDKNIDYRLKPLIQVPVDLPYDGGYEGLRALVNKLSNQLPKLQYQIERKIVQKFLKELSLDSGLAIYGYKEIQKALKAKVVNILIITEGFRNTNDFLSLANKYGVQVHIISKDTEEGEMIFKSFGGIVALARCRR